MRMVANKKVLAADVELAKQSSVFALLARSMGTKLEMAKTMDAMSFLHFCRSQLSSMED
jgi:hypothetical protein